MPSFSIELQGGVSFDVKSAREYVKEGQVDNVTISAHTTFTDDKSVKKKVYSYNTAGNVIGITVQYKDASDKAYIYGADGRLKYMDKYDCDVDTYPHRGYRYDLGGNLIITSLTVSKKEQFRFTPQGELVAHAINGIIYDENGNIIGTALKK